MSNTKNSIGGHETEIIPERVDFSPPAKLTQYYILKIRLANATHKLNEQSMRY